MKYALQYKDIPVLIFDTEYYSVTVVVRDLLPFGIRRLPADYSMVKCFCSDRILMMNREHCKELLAYCEIDDQSDINICCVCLGLSLCDNYWIKPVNSSLTWVKVNLHDNIFSEKIAYVGLTGNVVGSISLSDVYTGELTNKGTKAKCIVRNKDGVYLVKHETDREINAEITAYFIAYGFSLPCTAYYAREIHGLPCSMCKFDTSDSMELVLCRDIMRYFSESQITVRSNTFQYFSRDIKFLLMLLFDYVTLNVDRNRDNFGIMCQDGVHTGLYPLFDHDSCFKGKSTNGIYFPMSISFSKALDFLSGIKGLKQYINFDYLYGVRLKEVICSNLTEKDYMSFKDRLNRIHSVIK